MTASKDKCITADEKANYVNYDGIVDAVTKFEDEEDGIEKVMFIHPKQEKHCLLMQISFLLISLKQVLQSMVLLVRLQVVGLRNLRK